MSFLEKVRADVMTLLEPVGCGIDGADDALLRVCAERVEEEIRAALNEQSVPDGLLKRAAGMVAAEYLTAAKAGGRIDAEALAFPQTVKQISEGDTSVTYESGSAASAEQRFDAYVAALRRGWEGLIAFRRLAW